MRGKEPEGDDGSIPKTTDEEIGWLITNETASSIHEAGARQPVDDGNWHGVTESITFERGIYINLVQASLYRDFELRVTASTAPTAMSFTTMLDGALDINLPDGVRVYLEKGKTTCFRIKGDYGDYSAKAGTTIDNVGYTFENRFVETYLGDDLPEAWRPYLAEKFEHSLVDHMPTPPAILKLASEIAFCPHVGRIRMICLEGLAMQIIATHAALLHAPTCASLTAAEARMVAEARDFLLADMLNPPTLAELAQAVCMGERRLSQGFRMLYGEGPFSLLKGHRLDHARRALVDGTQPMKEVSWRIGYRHMSNFSSAFKARFGVNPKDVYNGGVIDMDEASGG